MIDTASTIKAGEILTANLHDAGYGESSPFNFDAMGKECFETYTKFFFKRQEEDGVEDLGIYDALLADEPFILDGDECEVTVNDDENPRIALANIENGEEFWMWYQDIKIFFDRDEENID